MLADILDPVFGNKASSVRDDGNQTTNSKISIKEQRTRKKFQQRSNAKKHKPIEIKVAGRTDRGVSAIGQVCRIRTWREDIENIELYIRDFVNDEMKSKFGGGLAIRNVEKVGGDFHPSFGASCRSYVYLIDLEDDAEKNDEDSTNIDDGSSSKLKRPRITQNVVPKLNQMLQALEGKELDYYALSHGKIKTQTTLCTLYHARAAIVEYDIDTDVKDEEGSLADAPEERGGCATKKSSRRKAICFELIGNRFLRRMVRLLVATALREAGKDLVVEDSRDDDDDDNSCEDDALIKILLSKDRRLRSRAAPPDGLIFVGAEFHS